MTEKSDWKKFEGNFYLERADGDLPNGRLSDFGEDGIAEFTEQGSRAPRRSVTEKQNGGVGRGILAGIGGRHRQQLSRVLIEKVHTVLEDERHVYVDQLEQNNQNDH